MTISSEAKTDNPAPNTLYAGAAGQTDQVQDVNVTMRFYLPDRLYLPVSPTSNVMGGVAPPTHTIVLADGKTYTGNAMCKRPGSSPRVPQQRQFLLVGCPQRPRREPAPLGPLGHPATRVPDSQRYYNQTQILKPLFQHTRFAFLIPFFYNETPAVSFFPNPANTYIIAPVDRRLGPASGGHNVFVMHFKIPTTPETYLGNRGPNDNDTVEARYMSLCTYTSPAIARNIQQFEKCLNDQTMLPDPNRMVTIVLSTAQDRPNARESARRRAWQKLSRYGNNSGGRPKQESLTPAFSPAAGWGKPPTRTCTGWSSASSCQTPTSRSHLNIPTNSVIKSFLGPYYPGGTYMTSRRFDRRHPCNGR